MNAMSDEHEMLTASLLMKFANFTEPKKVLGRQVLRCLGCAEYTTCSAGQDFIDQPRVLPDCPLAAKEELQ